MILSSAKTLTAKPSASHTADRPYFWMRTDAGPQIGFGHLKRCIVLAQSLIECGTPLFLIDSQDHWSQEQLADQGYDYFCGKLEEAWSFLPDPAVILIDTRNKDGLDRLMAAARNHNTPIVSIHDLGLNPLPSDIVIDGSIAPVRLDALAQKAKLYSGTDFMVLDPAYCSLRQRPMRIRERIGSILVNLGGGDSHRYFPRVLEGLNLWARHEVEVIGIPGFVPWGQERLVQKDWHPLRFRWESASAAQFLFSSDLAITAGGLAAYEALCAGTPLLALSYDHLQQTTITAIAAAGACIDLGPGDDLDPVQLAKVLSGIERNHYERRQVSLRGRRMVDGRGAERVSQIIRQLILKQTAAG